jgi:hypothetical protein
MVDFSDRKAIEHWFAEIMPRERRREVAVALAARAALRAVPLLSAELRRRRPRAAILSDLLPSFRAAAVAWAVARYPPPTNTLRVRATAASRAAVTATPRDAVSRAATTAAAAASRAAASRATTAAIAACCAAAEATLKAVAIAATAANAVADAAFAFDAASADSGYSGAELIGMPLWPSGAPDWANEDWQILKTTLLGADEGWDVWID